MAKTIAVTALNNPDRISDRVSVGDIEKYSFDFSAWQEDNDTITDIVWTVESGSAIIATPTLVSGVSTALITFSNAGLNLISIAAETSTTKKRVWMIVRATDGNLTADYGL